MMTDDEEKHLRQELLRKQEFWETPRNVAILLGVTAAIAAAIGFFIGRREPPPPPVVRPIIFGNFDMTGGQFIDAVQTACLAVIAVMVIYVVLRFDRALGIAVGKLKKALTTQRAMQEGIERVWSRVDTIESLQGTRKDFIPPAELMAMLNDMRSRLERLEAKNETPSNHH
jgi:hypothetical protein